MKHLILIALLAVLTLSISQRNHRPAHDDWNDFSRSITQECCKKQNGTQCGSADIDCCKLGCESHGWGWFSYQSCKGDQQIRDCPLSCSAQCKSKGGKLCGLGVLDNQQCCSDANCEFSTQTKGNACKPNTSININGCLKDSLRDQVAGHKHE